MKIKVESEKIVKAVKKLSGIDLVLEDPNDAREALGLILSREGLFHGDEDALLKDVTVSSFKEYKTSAVDYKLVFLLEFIFENKVSLDEKVSRIKEVQEFFNKV